MTLAPDVVSEADSPDTLIHVLIQSEPFDLTAEAAKLASGNLNVGGVVTFTGYCRDESDTLTGLELEHYPGMADAVIRQICKEASDQWPVSGLRVIHRYGLMRPGDPIVLVAAASRHRGAAFNAAEFVMDFLKTRAPFWKKEHRIDGQVGSWVDARDADGEALLRWNSWSASRLRASSRATGTTSAYRSHTCGRDT